MQIKSERKQKADGIVRSAVNSECGEIENVIQHERRARDAGLWDEMAACYHPDSWVEVSWFQGPGAEFVARSKDIAGGKVFTFHQLSPAAITVNGDRAIADSACCIHGISQIDGIEIDLMSHTRLLWRLRRSEKGWLVAGMRAYYIKDIIIPTNPARVPEIDGDVLESLRAPYRSIAYLMKLSGFPVRDDLAGVDRPESVAALRSGEQEWLADA
jgi:hypothetical protein